MEIWIYSLVFAMSSLVVMSQSCPSEHFLAVIPATIDGVMELCMLIEKYEDLDSQSHFCYVKSSGHVSEHFSAIFTGTIDGVVDNPNDVYVDDPELTHFKDHMKLKDSDIQHTVEDAMKFFNNTFGLDFSDTVPDEKNEYLLPNARMKSYILSSHVNFIISDNLWIRTGNTYTSCYYIRTGGLQVTFSADQMLHGSYGGTEGKPVGPQNVLLYGFDVIEVCKQSPIIIQFQSRSPFREEPIDGIYPSICDIYSRVLGQGKSSSVYQVYPDSKETGQYRVIFQIIYTFPS